ncbi:MAG: hypothetical protein IJA87_03185 [Clostridia bacterium]|nr:hypothetical protein [Clostridia bacterium]
MSEELVKAIKVNVDAMFTNADIMLQTCNMDFILCDLPIWKHAYHMLHSLDQWFINPKEYSEPDFHIDGLNSLNEYSETSLSREQLLEYLENIQKKIYNYLSCLNDDMLCEIPDGCKANRLSLMMSQIRHFYAHLGNINATTIIETNKWPRVVGITGKSGKSTSGLYE